MYDALVPADHRQPAPAPNPLIVPPHAPFRAGILNTIGGYYCSKAKNAMAGPKAIAPSN